MTGEIEVTMRAVPGTSPQQWEAQIRIYSELHVFKGSSSAVLAAVRVTLDELPTRFS